MVDKNKLITLTSTFTKSNLPTKDMNIDSIMIEGYASTADADRQGDIVPSSVWKSGITNYLNNPVILAYHQHSEPVGRMVDHRIDNRGLWIKARISAAAGEVFNLIKDGVLSAFSIGFRIIDAEYDAAKELFVVKELELTEISVVSVPANQNTLFSLSKSFNTAEEFKSFKLQFAPKQESAKGLESHVEASGNTTKEEWNMDPKELEKLLADTAKQAAAETAKAIAESQAKAAQEKAAQEKAQADLDARVKAAVAQVQTVDTGAERLLGEIEKRIAQQEESHKSALAGLEATLREKAHELEAIQKSRMQFTDNRNDAVSYADKEKAVLLAKMAGKSVEATKFGSDLIQKSGAHLPTGLTVGGVAGTTVWETEVSLNMEQEVRRRLVVAPLFRNIAMKTNVMTIPVNPEAGVASWVTNAQFGTSNSAGGTTATTTTGVGTPGQGSPHVLKEITLNAYKVATNEYTAYEEEEDSLIAIMPVIRDAMIRRVARAVDRAFLRGTGSGSDPVAGLTSYDSSGTLTTVSAASGVVTVANLRALRKGLGVWGLDPADVIFLVNSDVYYNLLEDTTFQTMNQVGPQATLLTGQIGQIGNSPVLVTGEFADKALNAFGAVAVAPSNFVVGNQRGLRIDTQELVETQRRVMVASLRTGMVRVTNNYGSGVATLKYAA